MRRGRAPAAPRIAALVLAALAVAGAGIADLNEAGTRAYARGDYAEAERLFRQAVTAAPADAVLHYHHGVALMRLMRFAEAAAAFRNALERARSPEIAARAKQALERIESLPRPAAGQRGDATPIRLEPLAGGWVVRVVVNGVREAKFLLDTGASITLLSPELASDLGISTSASDRSIRLHTVAGPTSGPVVMLESLRVGDMEVADSPAVVHSTGPGLDGILGNTFLSHFNVSLDPARGLLRLQARSPR